MIDIYFKDGSVRRCSPGRWATPDPFGETLLTEASVRYDLAPETGLIVSVTRHITPGKTAQRSDLGARCELEDVCHMALLEPAEYGGVALVSDDGVVMMADVGGYPVWFHRAHALALAAYGRPLSPGRSGIAGMAREAINLARDSRGAEAAAEWLGFPHGILDIVLESDGAGEEGEPEGWDDAETDEQAETLRELDAFAREMAATRLGEI